MASTSVFFIPISKIIKTQATIVVIRAPTAIGQKSLGVPNQVRGVRIAAETTIQIQIVRFTLTADSIPDIN